MTVDRLLVDLDVDAKEQARWEKQRQGVLRSIRYHQRAQLRREGKPLLRLHDNRRGWPGDPPVQP